MRKLVVVLLLGFLGAMVFGMDELQTQMLKVLGVSASCEGYRMNLMGMPKMDVQRLIKDEIFITIHSYECRDAGIYRI